MKNLYKAQIHVQLKESVLDPQGQAVTNALHELNFTEVQNVRIGKYIEVLLHSSDETDAKSQVKKYCETLLTNPVIETYQFQLEQIKE